MKVTATRIPEVLLIEPRVFGDARGFFFESFNLKVFSEALGATVEFVQDNHSRSSRGVLRGLHYQLAPHAQGKLVRVVAGEVFDVAVDIRPGSPTYGQWVAEILSAENKKQLWIPPGFAHGFVTLSDTAEFLYMSRPPITMRRNASAASAGMIRIWRSTGRWKILCCPPRMRRAPVFPAWPEGIEHQGA